MEEKTREYLRSRQRAGLKNSQVKTEQDHSGENISREALLLDASGAAKLLGLTKQYFYELQSSGRLVPMPIKFGNRSRWSRFELRAWVKNDCPPRERWLLIKKPIKSRPKNFLVAIKKSCKVFHQDDNKSDEITRVKSEIQSTINGRGRSVCKADRVCSCERH